LERSGPVPDCASKAGRNSRRGSSGAKGFRNAITDPAIEVDGDIAMVWAPFVVRVGGKVSNCGFDHFDLVSRKWRVESDEYFFSSRTAGCPTE